MEPIELTMLRDDGVAIVAARQSDTPGLAVFSDEQGWKVAHIHSGSLIDAFSTEAEAALLCRLLGELDADWTQGVAALGAAHGPRLAADILLAISLTRADGVARGQG